MFPRAHGLVDGAPELAGWAPTPEIGLGESARLGFIAARIAEELGGTGAYLAKRKHQSAWLVEHLALG